MAIESLGMQASLSLRPSGIEGGPAAPDQSQGSSQLLGCAAFWVRGGQEQTEH